MKLSSKKSASKKSPFMVINKKKLKRVKGGENITMVNSII